MILERARTYEVRIAYVQGHSKSARARKALFTPALQLRRCETLWSVREIASMALSVEQARHTENVFHIALRRGDIPTEQR